MCISLEEFAERAMDIPFLERGRSYDGWDCWGLVVVAYRDIYGIELPNLSNDYGSTRRHKELARLIDTKRYEWELMEIPQPGNLALLRLHQLPCHIGIMLTPKLILHVEEAAFAIVEEIDRAPWKGSNYNNVEGIYRYVG